MTEKVHEAPGASVAAARLTVPDPAAAAIVPPPQVPVRPLGVATLICAGRLSVNAIPLRVAESVAGFVTVYVSWDVPLRGTVDPPKAIEKDN